MCEQNVNAFFPVPANCWKPCQIFLPPFCFLDICPACCAYLETGFPPGFAAGVPREKNYLPRTCEPLREWSQARARLLGESLEERFPQTPFRPFCAAKTSVLAEFFWDGSPLPRLGAAPCKWASPGPSPVVGRKPNNPLGAPGTETTSPGGSRLLCRWFAPGLAAGVSRGENYLPRTHAPLRGWERALARPAWGNLLRRDSPRPLSDLFTPPKHPFWRKFFETFPPAEAGGGFLQTGKPWPLAGCWEKAQQSTRGPGDGNDFPWG